MKTHYFDNSASTMPSEAARRAFTESLALYGNPSSAHFMGVEAHRLLEDSREKVLLALGVRHLDGGALVFTSSGTEANCLCLLGYDAAKRRARGGKFPTVLITDSEHPSISEPALRLEAAGYRVVRIPTAGGELDFGALMRAVGEAGEHGGVALASFMLVNNETGALYDVKRAAGIVHTSYPNAVVHCDAVQGFMKVRFSPSSLGVDALTVSAHKIHAPRGAGALYLSPELVKRREIAPILPGGGQEGRLRSGTENLCAVSAFAAAAEEYRENFDEYSSRIASVRSAIDKKLESLPDIRVKRSPRAVPGILNLTLPRIKSETMLNFLSGRGICVSAGSACSSNSRASRPSDTLMAFGSTRDEADASIRVSIGRYNTEEDADALVSALAEGLMTLKRF